MISKKIFKNAGILASGDVLSALIGMICFSILAKSLTVEYVGVFAVISVYVKFVNQFINFQSWQAVIKFGNNLEYKNNKNYLEKLYSFGFYIDIISAAFAFIISFFLCDFISIFFEWNADTIVLIKLFSFTILFKIEGSPTAIFRMRNKFIVFSKKLVISAIIKLVFFVYCFYYSANLESFIIATMVSQFIGSTYFINEALKLYKINFIYFLRFKNVVNFLEINNGLIKFLFITNFQSSIRISSSLFDTLLVNIFFGDYTTGLFQIVKQFAKFFTQLSSPLYKSIYPELVKFWTNNNKVEFKNLIKNGVKVGSFVSLFMYTVSILGADFFIKTYAGIDYLDSKEIMIYYLLGSVIHVLSFPFSPAMLAMGYPMKTLKITIFSSVIYFLVFFLFHEIFGEKIIGVSFLSMSFTYLIFHLYQLSIY